MVNKMLLLFYFVALQQTIDVVNAQSAFNKYCNARFGFCISYPGNFKAQGESDNGDGQEFLSLDGKSSLLAYRDGREVIYESQSECKRQSYLSDATSDATKKVTYKTMGDNFYVVSGYEGSSIFYQKTIFTDEGMMTVIFTYPASQKAKYDSYCVKIFETFK
jgi:hypothetical protein